MSDKRGLSQIVNTILIILVVLVAIGIIWGVVSEFVTKGANQINLDRFTMDLKIQSAHIDYDTGVATVRVVRNSGEGELSEIKFIVEDDKGSDIFTREVVDFQQLASRTFTLNLLDSEFLTLNKIHKISVAPVYIGNNGQPFLGDAADGVDGLNKELLAELEEGGDDGSDPACTVDADCEDAWMGIRRCNQGNTGIEEMFDDMVCGGGTCVSVSQSWVLNETCDSGFFCDGFPPLCKIEPITCSVETDCGVDGWLDGTRVCSFDQTQVLQDYIDFSCEATTCSSTTNTQVVETCDAAANAKCFGGSCQIQAECSIDSDCWFTNGGQPNGKVCNSDGECVDEEVVQTGTAYSVWPSMSGEYMDSEQLPVLKANSDIAASMYVVFPGSATQRTCLQIKNYYTPSFEGGLAYLQFFQTPNNVSVGDNYEIWPTSYRCSLPEYNY